MREVDEAISSFLRGQLTIAFILACIDSIGLLLLGVPLGLVIGIVAGLANMAPYMSLVIGLLPALLLSWAEHGSAARLVGVFGVFGGAQLLEGAVLSPRILAKRVHLHPVWVLLAILAGGNLFGFFGMLLAVPTAAALQVYARHAVAAYKRSRVYGASADAKDGDLPDEEERNSLPIREIPVHASSVVRVGGAAVQGNDGPQPALAEARPFQPNAADSPLAQTLGARPPPELPAEPDAAESLQEPQPQPQPGRANPANAESAEDRPRPGNADDQLPAEGVETPPLDRVVEPPPAEQLPAPASSEPPGSPSASRRVKTTAPGKGTAKSQAKERVQARPRKPGAANPPPATQGRRARRRRNESGPK